MGEVVYIYDTTLRDGRQGENVDFSLIDMLEVVKKLDEFGVDYIEGGWPASNPKDKTFFQEVKKIELKHAKISAFGSTRHAKNRVEEDPNTLALIEAETPVVTIFGKSWDLHVREVFNISLEKNLEMVYDTIAFLKDKGKEVIFDAEHFFDGFKENPDYALRVLREAERAGVDNITLADTNGGSLPWEIEEAIKAVKEVVKTPLGIHAHNDSELGVVNSIIAVKNGVVLVQGTMNGIGERVGNANLTSIIPILILKMKKKLNGIDEEKLKMLTKVSMYIYELANMIPNPKQPFVGMSAFAHKGGVHVNAVIKNPRTYEHIDPTAVGNTRRILVSEQAGRSNIKEKLKELNIEVDENDLKRITEEVKRLESEGYWFEGADASFEILVKKLTNRYKKFFNIIHYTVISRKGGEGSNPTSEAIVKVEVDSEIEVTAAEGDGPVHALDNALKKALSKFYPDVMKNLKLVDYKVRIINPKEGTAAKIRVLITSQYKEEEWQTIGVSENIIEASWQALIDSIEYILNKVY